MLKFYSFYSRYPRRKFLKHLGLAGVGILAACSTPANNTTDNNQPVKIGAMYFLTGGFATYGEFAFE
ncbi:hypothetical protein [Dapis sp. BLCC M229]|uniref:hypothetical protein n=1 Tax=Dapis sp. BLCC M229 TaxID=3400188 RepID=UPI003CEBFD2D